MNERIRELWFQAYEFANSNCCDEFGSVDEYKRRSKFEEKFAELIVKECAKKAVLFADSTTIQGLPSKHIENYMLKHFGVK